MVNTEIISDAKNDREILENIIGLWDEYINTTGCEWCTRKATAMKMATEELLDLEDSATDFMTKLAQCNVLNQFGDDHE